MREDWVEITLKDILEKLETGKRPKGGVSKYTEGIPSIGGEHLNSNGAFYLNNLKFVPEKFAAQMTKGILEIKDILIVKDGATTGKVSFVDQNFPFKFAVLNEHVFKCKLVKGLHPKFIFYFLFSSVGQKRILRNFKGSAQGGINTSFAPNTLIPLAPLPIQRAIIHKIENLFASLDKGIADFKKAQEQLKVYRQAVLKKAFEGELTKEWREKQTNLLTADEILEQIKEKRLKYYNSQLEIWEENVRNWERNKEGRKPIKPKFKFELSEVERDKSIVNNMDASYTNQNLHNVTRLITDGKHGDCTDSPNSGYFFLSAKDIQNGMLVYENARQIKFDEFLEVHNRTNLQFGDICLVNTGATVGKLAIAPNDFKTPKTTFQKSVAIIKVFDNIMNNVYLKYLLIWTNKKLFNTSKGTAVNNLLLKDIRNITFPLPSYVEQKQIVREIESRLSVCDKVEQNITEGLEKSEALRQSILKKAFEGKLLSVAEIEQCKQEADYEPALKLLERIKQNKNP